jgi:hypothetical protein
MSARLSRRRGKRRLIRPLCRVQVCLLRRQMMQGMLQTGAKRLG